VKGEAAIVSAGQTAVVSKAAYSLLYLYIFLKQ